jgi:Heavy-metal resistance
MRKWMVSITVIGLLLLTASAVGAHWSRWWETPEIAQALKLNDAEIQQLDQAYEALSLRLIELKSRVDAERFKWQAMLEKEELDEPALDAQYNRVEKARAALGKERYAFFVKVRKIIGPQRFHQLMEIYNARRQSHK